MKKSSLILLLFLIGNSTAAFATGFSKNITLKDASFPDNIAFNYVATAWQGADCNQYSENCSLTSSSVVQSPEYLSSIGETATVQWPGKEGDAGAISIFVKGTMTEEPMTNNSVCMTCTVSLINSNGALSSNFINAQKSLNLSILPTDDNGDEGEEAIISNPSDSNQVANCQLNQVPLSPCSPS